MARFGWQGLHSLLVRSESRGPGSSCEIRSTKSNGRKVMCEGGKGC